MSIYILIDISSLILINMVDLKICVSAKLVGRDFFFLGAQAWDEKHCNKEIIPSNITKYLCLDL